MYSLTEIQIQLSIVFPSSNPALEATYYIRQHRTFLLLQNDSPETPFSTSLEGG